MRLAVGHAAGFGLCDGDDGWFNLVGFLGDGAEDLGLGCYCSLWCDLVILSACLAWLHD